MEPRCVCVVAAATSHWMISSRLQARTWSMISCRNGIMMLRCGAHIREASRQLAQAFTCSIGSFIWGISDSSDTLKSSDTMLLLSLPVMSKAVWMKGMWLGYTSTIKLWILTLQALRPRGSIRVAAQLEISRGGDAMLWLDGRSMIRDVSGCFSGTLQGGRMSDNMVFVGEVLCLILV